MRDEAVSASISVVVYLFATIRKEVTLTEMFCINKEKKGSTITRKIHRGLGITVIYSALFF